MRGFKVGLMQGCLIGFKSNREDFVMIEFYRVEMINDDTGKKKVIFVQARNNPRDSLVKIDDMRVFWCVQLSCEQYEKQKKEWQHD